MSCSGRRNSIAAGPAARKATFRCCLLGALAIAGLIDATAAGAANERRACGLFLDSYRELGKVAEFKIALRCDAGQREGFAVNEPLLVGLTATSSDKRENDRVEFEYDFPVQPALVSPDTTAASMTFHAHLGDISGKSYVYAKTWPRSFLQDCAEGRSGCMKFGYALALPMNLAQPCVKKDESGYTQISDDFLCKGSGDYRFKFR